MIKIITAALTVVTVSAMMMGSALADGNTDKVVAKMAEGNVSEICQGGRATITTASKNATRALAKAGEISGDFPTIGKAAGAQFYKEKC
ncbi:MAG: hypothetical protein V7740_10250 [Pseudomonas marincola]